MCASVRAPVHTFKHEYLRSQPAGHSEILSDTSLGWGKACDRFGARSEQNYGSIAIDSSHRLIMGETLLSRFLSSFDRILFILAGNDDKHVHKSLDEFKIRPDLTPDQRASKKSILPLFSWISFILMLRLH